jgi:hypothetical protein
MAADPIPIVHNYKLIISSKEMVGGVDEAATMTMYEDGIALTTGVTFEIIEPNAFKNANISGNILRYTVPVTVKTPVTIQATYGDHTAQSWVNLLPIDSTYILSPKKAD